MDSCSGATYISKKYLIAYQEKRQKHQAKKEAQAQQLEKVDEEEQMVIQPRLPSSQLNQGASAAPDRDNAQADVEMKVEEQT